MRHAGKQNDDVAIGFEPQRRSGATRIRQDRGAFGNHGLAFIYFGHGAREAAKTLLDFAHDGFVQVQLAAEQVGNGFARAVVIGGAEAAAGDDQVGAIEGVAKGRAHFVARITDDCFVDHANANLV